MYVVTFSSSVQRTLGAQFVKSVQFVVDNAKPLQVSPQRPLQVSRSVVAITALSVVLTHVWRPMLANAHFIVFGSAVQLAPWLAWQCSVVWQIMGSPWHMSP